MAEKYVPRRLTPEQYVVYKRDMLKLMAPFIAALNIISITLLVAAINGQGIGMAASIFAVLGSFNFWIVLYVALRETRKNLLVPGQVTNS